MGPIMARRPGFVGLSRAPAASMGRSPIWIRPIVKLRNFLVTLGGTLCVAFCCGVLPVTAQSVADATDPAYQAKVERLIELTDGKTIGRSMASLVTQSLLRSTQLPPRAAQIVSEEVEAFFDENLDALVTSLIPVYAKYYTEADLDALIEFYESPIGQKLAEVTPAFSQDSFQAGQRVAQERLPQFQERLRSRLEAEGLL